MAKQLEPDSVAARAARELRDAPAEPNWVDISSSIISKVRNTTRRTWPIDAEYPAGSGASEQDGLRVSDHLVRTAVRRALAGVHGAQPTQIDLHIDDHRCIGLSLTVTGVYGQDLLAVGEELKIIAVGVVEHLLGVRLDPATIDVLFDDLEEHPVS